MYRTVAQLDSVMNILSSFFPALCTRVELPNRSIQGRPIYALRMHAGSATNRRGVLIAGGLHARELMNPDAIADLQLDLALAYLNETGITLGGRSWSATDIKIMMESLFIWTLPCANPDGREYVMTVDDLWRQNRRDNPGTTCEGVDINRNCDVVWGVTNSATSCNPCMETYLGSGRFSEPEARNIRDLCDLHGIDVFLDVHSFTELVLFPWGHAPTQTTDPTQRFTGLPTGTCAPLNPPGHQEYMLPRDQLRFTRVAQTVVNDIRAVRGRSYTPQPSRSLYATTGTSSDYVYSRHIANPALRKTYGFAFETGPTVLNPDGTINIRESFHPADPTLIKRDAKAGMISLLQQSICAIEFIGATFLGITSGLQVMRKVRDEQLVTTTAGSEMVALFERVQFPLLGVIMTYESLTKDAMSLLDMSLKLLDDEDARLTEREVARGLAFIDALVERTKSEDVLYDLATVRKQLEASTEKSVRQVLDGLLGRSDREQTKQRKKSKKSRRKSKPPSKRSRKKRY